MRSNLFLDRGFDPVFNVVIVEILQLNVCLFRSTVNLMIVLSLFYHSVSIQNESSIALVSLVPNAQPVSSRSNLPLTSEDKSRLDDQRSTTLTSDKRPKCRRLVAILSISFVGDKSGVKKF